MLDISKLIELAEDPLALPMWANTATQSQMLPLLRELQAAREVIHALRFNALGLAEALDNYDRAVAAKEPKP